jgi:hypothetical protein
LHDRVEADAASQSEIGSLSDLQFVVHADSKAPEKTAASAGPSQGDLSRSRWAARVAPSRTRRVQREMSGRTAPVACGWERNGGNERLRCRCRPKLKFASSRRTASQVCHASHIQPCGDFAQPLSTGGEETAEQSTTAQFVHLSPPALGVTPQPVENSGQLRRDRRLSLAIKPPRVIDQKEIATQRESFQHPLATRIQPTPILDRAQPQRLFQAG